MSPVFNAKAYKERLALAESIETCEKVPLPKIGEGQNYIFISYSHRDFREVYADLADLYAAGVRFWYDKGLPAGKNWDEVVESHIADAACAGVVFYLSKNLFLSASVSKEINLALGIGTDGASPKNFFCVNLTDKQPSRILASVMREDDETLERAGIDMERINVLSGAFTDKATYLPFSSPLHSTELVDQIREQFNVVCEPVSDGGFADGEYRGDLVNGKRHGKGVFRYTNGDVYDGEWQNDLPEGHGVLEFGDGRLYDGAWQAGHRFGEGRYVTQAGEVYEGEWENDVYHGKGTYTWRTGETYTGDWVNGVRTGKGCFVYAQNDDRETYTGEWKNNLRHGKGVMTWKTGARYDGEWKNDVIEGEGVLQYGEAGRQKAYTGRWVNGKRDGIGAMTWKDGAVYDGEWKEDKRNGYGIQTLANGTHYEGLFVDGRYNGNGVMTFSADSRFDSYTGGWKNDGYDGSGVLIWKDGQKYEGNFAGGYYDGQGTMTYAPSSSMDSYVGGWKFDKPDGSGVLTWKNGQKYEGEFVGGLSDGQGTMTFASDSEYISYTGAYKKAKWHGNGVLTYRDGSTFTGEFSEGKLFEGEGKVVFVKGVYVGAIRDGKPNGYGCYDYPEDSACRRYEGEWVNASPHGKGIMRYANGSDYEGEWVEGKREGQGKATYADGTYREGLWSEGVFISGVGTEMTSRGIIKARYEKSYQKPNKLSGLYFDEAYGYLDEETGKKMMHGVYKDGRVLTYEIHGLTDGFRTLFGTIDHPDGTCYEGQIRFFEYDGLGTMRFPGGETFTGRFREGYPDGKGVFIFADGVKRTGQFSQGESRLYSGFVLNGDFCGYVQDPSGQTFIIRDGKILHKVEKK